MSRKRLIEIAGGIFSILVSSVGFTAPSFASTPDNAVGELAELNPGMTRAEVVLKVNNLSGEIGLTPKEIINQALLDARASAAASTADVVSLRSGGGNTTLLGSGSQKGDVFWSPAATLFIQHGHSGIYYSKAVVVEAPGLGKNSWSIYAKSVRVGSGTQKQHVLTTQKNRDAAANYAYRYMRNKPYNNVFFDNKHVPSSSYNCSQLVWGAYKKASNIDLDGNGGLGVYPVDIRDSRLTSTYSIIW